MTYPGNDPENGPAINIDAKDHHGHAMYDRYGNRTYTRKDGKPYCGPDWRKDKRYDRKMFGDAVLDAVYLGEDHGHHGIPNKNPYPAGERYEAYEYGWKFANPMGEALLTEAQRTTHKGT
jgi:hypothetical protein